MIPRVSFSNQPAFKAYDQSSLKDTKMEQSGSMVDALKGTSNLADGIKLTMVTSTDSDQNGRYGIAIAQGYQDHPFYHSGLTIGSIVAEPEANSVSFAEEATLKALPQAEENLLRQLPDPQQREELLQDALAFAKDVHAMQ